MSLTRFLILISVAAAVIYILASVVAVLIPYVLAAVVIFALFGSLQKYLAAKDKNQELE